MHASLAILTAPSIGKIGEAILVHPMPENSARLKALRKEEF